MEHEISIGAIIGAVTGSNEAVEFADGSYQIPDALHERIEARLERELMADDDKGAEDEGADGGEDDYGWPSYEVRMRKERRKKRRKIQVVPIGGDGAKTKRKTKKEAGRSSKRTAAPKTKRATATKSKKTSKSRKLVPRPEVKELSDPWQRKTRKIDAFNGDTQRASKETIRACRSKDRAALRRALEGNGDGRGGSVADPFVRQSPDVDENAMSYALFAEDEVAVRALWRVAEAEDAGSGAGGKRPAFPECTLLGLSSGRHTSRYADYGRREVGATRGGKEGNNAFFEDLSGGRYHKTVDGIFCNRNLVNMLRTHDSISIPFLEFLNKEFFKGNLFDWSFDFQRILEYGHREIAQYVMKLMLPRGVGLNPLHVDTLGEGHTIEKILPVSVEKKSSNNVRFCPIHCAASNPNPTYLKQLLEKKADAVDCLDSNDASLLHYAALGEGPDTLKWLLDGPGASLNRHAKTRKGPKMTPLMWAVRAGRAENVRVLCNGGSSPLDDGAFQIKDATGMTAMHHAAESSRRSRLDTVRALLECGASPDIAGDTRLLNKKTPAMMCAARGDLDLLKVLVEGGADLTQTDKLDKTLLVYAAKNGHTHLVSYLLRAGVDANAADSSGNTPMHYASAYGWVDCVTLLLQVGADADPKNDWSSTPLELALKKGRYACAVALLKEKVDVNVRDKNGLSLFGSLVQSYVCSLSRDPARPLPWAIRQIMNREELDIASKDSSGRTLLHHIAQGPSGGKPLLDFVDLILSRGVDPLLECKSNQVAIEISLDRGSLDLALKLLRHTSHAVYTGRDRNLMHRLMQNITRTSGKLFMEVFTELHECKGDWIEQVDGNGHTPLMLAACEMQSKWRNQQQKGHPGELFEKICYKIPDRLGDVSSRKKDYRIEVLEDLKQRLDTNPEESDYRFSSAGMPLWHFSSEYASGPRTVLHYVLQCPDVAWALKMSKKIFEHTTNGENLLHLKTNTGEDSMSFALETFIFKKAPVQPTLELLKLLQEKGARVNGVLHPLFSSLSEAKNNILEVAFGAKDYSLSEAYNFVRYRQRIADKKKLADSRKRNDLYAQFEPPLQKLLKRNEARRPSPELLLGLIESCGFSPDAEDIFGNTAMHLAPSMDIELVRRLLPFANINAVNNEGSTPLILSVGDAKLVNLLVDSGADVDVVSKKGAALHLAARNQSCKVVNILIKKCNVNVTDSEGRTALHYAVAARAVSEKEMLDPVENQLLLAGANTNATDKYKRTPLHYAFFSTETDTMCSFPPSAARDPIDMVTTLSRSEGTELGKADEDKRTPLHYAAAVGASICVLYLCENSQDSLHAVDVDNNTALGLALMAGRESTTTLLISRGSKLAIPVSKVVRTRKNGIVKETSKEVQSPLWFALKGNGCKSVARYMLAANKLSVSDILSSLLSTENFQLAMQQIKLCGSKKLQATDQETGMTGLHFLANVTSFRAAPAFASALVDAIVECGVEVSIKCNKGRTALHNSCFLGHIDLSLHLISAHGADVDVEDLQKNTPLSMMFEGSRASAKLLCILANASTNKARFVNHPLMGKYDTDEEMQWHKKCDLGKYLLFTPEEEHHAEEAYIEHLKTTRERKAPHCNTKSAIVLIETTPLIQSLNWDTKITNALLSFGADGTRADKNGRTVLHHAVIKQDIVMVDLILKWKCVPLNALDKFGRSALTYAVLASLDETSDDTMNRLLLNHGSDPTVGKAMELAIGANRQTVVRKMLKIAGKSFEQTKKQRSNSYKEGDVVWVRYRNSCSKWELATVVFVRESQVGVLPKNLEKHLPMSLEDQHCLVIVGENMDIHTLKMESDVALVNAQDLLLSLMAESELPNERKLALIKEHEGCEVQLLKRLEASPQKDALSSKLSPGDDVGYMQNMSFAPKLYVGKVKSAHKNGQYDVDLINGETIMQVNRFLLRPLRKELTIPTKNQPPKLSSYLVHACVKPVTYGSFEDLGLLRELVESGAPADEKDENGESPLDKARPGSEIQAYLRKVTSSEKGRSLPERLPLSIANRFDNQVDADKEHAALLAAGAGISERIIPKVSDVCELDSDGIHVLADGEDFFDVVLSKVDVEHGRYGKYVFYKMQIVFDPIRKTYVLITNWGRIGEDTGKFQQTPFGTAEDCVKEFKKVFKSKSGNGWDTKDSFERKSGKYVVVHRPRMRLINPEELLQDVVESSTHPCSLAASVSDIFRFLLNPQGLFHAYKCQSIDSSMLPFGQLSLSTVQAAEAKLLEVKLRLEEKKEAFSESKSVSEMRKAYEALSKASSEFYELMPKGDDIVRPFENDNDFKLAYDLIRELRDLTVSKQLLLGARHRQASMNPMDYVYGSLGVSFRPLENDSFERRCLLQYVDNTSDGSDALVHNIYALDDGKDASDIPNKRLLFHGSRNQNILGILKSGLLIAPPEAPVSGYAFGKGVYFADQFSKSLDYTDISNHCDPESDDRPRGFVFVAEVALGESYMPSGVEYMEQCPVGTHSTHALGRETPDESKELVLDATGARISLGKLKKSKKAGPGEYRWKHSRNRWSRDYLDDKENMKVEKLRLDPATKFPLKVTVQYNGTQQYLTLLGPNSASAKMNPTKVSDVDVPRMDGSTDREESRIDGEMDVDDHGSSKADQEMDPLFGESESEEDIRIYEDLDSEEELNGGGLLFVREEKIQNTVSRSEFIVYDTKQVRLKYLIELTSKEWVKRKFLERAKRNGYRAYDYDTEEQAMVEESNINFGKNVGDSDDKETAAWFVKRVYVSLKENGAQAIIKDVQGNRAVLEMVDDKSTLSVENWEVSMVLPQEKDTVLATGGANTGDEGVVVCIDGTDVIVQDANEAFSIVDFVHLATIALG